MMMCELTEAKSEQSEYFKKHCAGDKQIVISEFVSDLGELVLLLIMMMQRDSTKWSGKNNLVRHSFAIN